MGTAPGLWLEYKDKIFIMLPGPPSELTDVCEKQLLPRMLQRFSKHGIIMSRTLHLRGIGESMVAAKLDELIMAQTNPTIALYARYGEILIRLTAKAANDKEAVKCSTLWKPRYARALIIIYTVWMMLLWRPA